MTIALLHFCYYFIVVIFLCPLHHCYIFVAIIVKNIMINHDCHLFRGKRCPILGRRAEKAFHVACCLSLLSKNISKNIALTKYNQECCFKRILAGILPSKNFSKNILKISTLCAAWPQIFMLCAACLWFQIILVSKIYVWQSVPAPVVPPPRWALPWTWSVTHFSSAAK